MLQLVIKMILQLDITQDISAKIDQHLHPMMV